MTLEDRVQHRLKFDDYRVWEGKHVKVSCIFPRQSSREARFRYLMKQVDVDSWIFGYPEDATYELEIDLSYPIGSLYSPIEYGEFLYYGCTRCGYKFYDDESEKKLRYNFGDACPRCGKHRVESICDGKPHKHRRYYVFQLHILDLKVRDMLSTFLGVDPDSCLGFSCKGSWHNHRFDNSGYDVCHKNCLDELIDFRLRENLRGIDLFIAKYPELGVVFTGNYDPLTGWKDGEQVSQSEFELVKTEVGRRKDVGLNPTFYKVLDEVI